MRFSPIEKTISPVVPRGDFVFAASHFEHAHIYQQIDGLTEAGGLLKLLYEPDEKKTKSVIDKHPECRVVTDFREILDDKDIQLVTSAAVPWERCNIGVSVLEAGKDYFTDKAPLTTLDQLAFARAKVKETGRKYMVWYGERLGSEAAWHAGILLEQGVIGKVVQVVNLAPHRLGHLTRPAWFFQKAKTGGILVDIGSHQFEQFLHYTGASGGSVNFARVLNLATPNHPEFEDFGEASLTMDNGASCYCRLDWLNPDGLRTWGDGRTFILGTKGYMELRKYIDVARTEPGNRIFLVNGEGEFEIPCEGLVGYPFFGQLILDVLNRTELAMTQKRAFQAAELSIQAQAFADRGKA